jgi:hypothetical protein
MNESCPQFRTNAQIVTTSPAGNKAAITDSGYADQIEALRQQRDNNIQSLPVVTDINLAFCDACHDLALQHGDRHGANNWQQARMMALHVRAAA